MKKVKNIIINHPWQSFLLYPLIFFSLAYLFSWVFNTYIYLWSLLIIFFWIIFCRSASKRKVPFIIGMVICLIMSLIFVVNTMYITHLHGTKIKKAEVSLYSIYLAEEEYKLNNGSYYYKPGCSSNTTKDIIKELFDGVDDLSNQDFYYCTSGSSDNDTLTIEAYNSAKGCRLRYDEKNKLTKSNC